MIKRTMIGRAAFAGLVIGAGGCLAEATVADQDPGEAVASAESALQGPAKCVTLRRGGLGNVADTQIASNRADKNYGDSVTFIAGDVNGAWRESLLRFDLSAIPAGATITVATAQLNEGFVYGAPRLVGVHLVTAPWNESTVTWDSFGNAAAASPFTTFGNNGSTYTGPVNFDLTDLVQSWYAGAPNYGVLLRQQTNMAFTSFASSEDANPAARPALTVCYTADWCVNGTQDGDETGVDCGGSCGACQAPTCNDGAQNQGETGVDCGGPCAACATCNDGLMNQGETGIDCGGPCAPCACPTGMVLQGGQCVCPASLVPRDTNGDGVPDICGICAGAGCNTGTSWGDPHLVSFDGLKYDFQAHGEFIAVTDEQGFVIQARERPIAGTSVALNKAVAAKVAGDVIGFYVGKSPALRIGGQGVTVQGGALALPGGGLVYSADNANYTVLWPTGEVLAVSVYGSYINYSVDVPAARSGAIKGLLGDFDGDADNDLATRAGVPVALPPSFTALQRTFGDSWRIAQAESLFEYDPGESTATHTDLTWPAGPVSSSSLSQAAYNSAKATCQAAGVVDPILLDACILDVGTTGDPSFAQGLDVIAPPTLAFASHTATFENGAGPAWTSGLVSTTPGTPQKAPTKFLGPFSNDSVGFTLNNVPPHTQATVTFDLYVIATWDGNSGQYGPDVWTASVGGGPLLVSTTFANFQGALQAYPGNYPAASNPAFTGALEVGTLGYAQSSVYRMSYTFNHSSSTFAMKFNGSGLQGVADESWGLDNFEVSFK